MNIKGIISLNFLFLIEERNNSRTTLNYFCIINNFVILCFIRHKLHNKD